jgi:hypothetical protein
MLFFITSVITLHSFAQHNDSVKIISQKDTVVASLPNEKETVLMRVGKLIVITKGSSKKTTANVESRNNKKPKPVSTNWWVIDLGFANLVDNTNYTTAQTQGYLNNVNGDVTANSMALRTWKTSNVNIWFFMQKLNIHRNAFNLKYGLGLEMYNFRYKHNLSYRKDPYPHILNDTLNFSKNKLYAGYLTVPLMLNFNPLPNNHNSFSMSVGVSAGYLVGSHQKQISSELGKQKYRDDFNLNPWRFAAVGEIGLGEIRLYGSYSLNGLYKPSTGLNQTPYAVGIRLSNW